MPECEASQGLCGLTIPTPECEASQHLCGPTVPMPECEASQGLCGQRAICTRCVSSVPSTAGVAAVLQAAQALLTERHSAETATALIQTLTLGANFLKNEPSELLSTQTGQCLLLMIKSRPLRESEFLKMCFDDYYSDSFLL